MRGDDQMSQNNAYVDDQMSAAERKAYEAGLDDEQLREARDARRFQRRLEREANSLPGCPDALWNSLRGRLERSENPRREPWIEWRGLKPLGIAAALVANIILALFITLRLAGPPAAPLVQTAFSADRSRFVAEGRWAGDWEKLCRCLAGNGFPLSLASEQACRELGLELLGVRYQYLNGERIAQVMLRQEGRLATVFIGQRKTLAMKNLPQAELGGGLVAACREVGDYRLIALSEDRPQALLSLFF